MNTNKNLDIGFLCEKMFCGACGEKIILKYAAHKTAYYHCSSVITKECKNILFLASLLENTILNEIYSVIHKTNISCLEPSLGSRAFCAKYTEYKIHKNQSLQKSLFLKADSCVDSNKRNVIYSKINELKKELAYLESNPFFDEHSKKELSDILRLIKNEEELSKEQTELFIQVFVDKIYIYTSKIIVISNLLPKKLVLNAIPYIEKDM